MRKTVQNDIEKLTTIVQEFTESLEKQAKTVINNTAMSNVINTTIDGIIQKGKELSIEEIRKDVDSYIKETYGIIPRKIEIKKGKEKKELEGIFHSEFENILKIVDKNIPLMLTGPAGSGKNFTLEQTAKALGLDFYFTNAITQEYKLTGFIDANGTYHETEFFKAFTKGGLFFLDEVDASCPESLLILNSAIANKYFDFPIGRFNAHEDFRVVCAGNTYGTGADMVYVGRNVLDGATLDRFVVLQFDYDEEVEKSLSYDEELYAFITSLRKAIQDASLRYIVSMRATINASKLLEIGVNKNVILRDVIIKSMSKDDLNIIIKKMGSTSRYQEWFDALKKLC